MNQKRPDNHYILQVETKLCNLEHYQELPFKYFVNSLLISKFFKF